MSDYLDKLKSQLAGFRNMASAGWNDEGNANLLSAIPMPDDGTGISRDYAAGDAADDYGNKFRSDDAELERRFPSNYTSGQMLGAVPGVLAAGALGAGSGGSIPAAGLLGGLRGAISGAGNASEGNRIQGAARAAGPSALLGMAAEAAPMALNKARDLFGKMPPPGDGMAPVTAGIPSSMAHEAADLEKSGINMSAGATNPGRRLKGRAPAPVQDAEPPTGKWPIPKNDEELMAQGRADWAKDYPEQANQLEHTPVRKAALPPPPSGEEDLAPILKEGEEALPPVSRYPALGKAPPGKNPVNEHLDFLGKEARQYHNDAQLTALKIENDMADRAAGLKPKNTNLNDPNSIGLDKYPARKYPVYRQMDAHLDEMNRANFSPEMPGEFPSPPSTISRTMSARPSGNPTVREMFGELPEEELQ